MNRRSGSSGAAPSISSALLRTTTATIATNAPKLAATARWHRVWAVRHKQMVFDIGCQLCVFRELLVAVGQPYGAAGGDCHELRERLRKTRRKLVEHCKMVRGKVAVKNHDSEEYTQLILSMEMLLIELRRCHDLIQTYPLHPPQEGAPYPYEEHKQLERSTNNVPLTNGEVTTVRLGVSGQHPSVDRAAIANGLTASVTDELLKIQQDMVDIQQMLDELHNRVAIPDWDKKQSKRSKKTTPTASSSSPQHQQSAVTSRAGSAAGGLLLCCLCSQRPPEQQSIEIEQ